MHKCNLWQLWKAIFWGENLEYYYIMDPTNKGPLITYFDFVSVFQPKMIIKLIFLKGVYCATLWITWMRVFGKSSLLKLNKCSLWFCSTIITIFLIWCFNRIHYINSANSFQYLTYILWDFLKIHIRNWLKIWEGQKLWLAP